MALAAIPGFAIYIEHQDYLPVPDASKPLDELLPKKGVESTGGRGMLEVNSSFLKRKHDVNFETRQVEIVRYLALPGGPAAPAIAGVPASPSGSVGSDGDSTALWQAYYRELNDYSVDMSELALRRLWLAQFIGKEESNQAMGPGLLDISLPVTVPDWMKRIGVDKPRLRINGSYKLVVEGSRTSGTGAPGGGDSWFPNLHMDQQPAFSVKGSIGRLINIEINSEEGFGTNLKEQLKITYKGEGDELEDDIIQEIEAGNTSLALTGTSLTGYTEAHKGLFGLKIRMKFGGLEVTTIASQEGGSQERQKLGAGTELHDFVIEDRAMDLHRHFFLKLQDRVDYGNLSQWTLVSGNSVPPYVNGGKGRRTLEVYQLLLTGEDPSIPASDTARACVYDVGGNKEPQICEAGRWKALKEGSDWYYDDDMRMLTVPAGNRNMSIAVRWQNDFIPPIGGRKDPLSYILIHSRSVVGNPDLDNLMWKNVYNTGRISKQDKESFRIRLVRSSDSLDRDALDTITFIRKLGLERIDKKGLVNIDDPKLFNLDLGYMVLPCQGGLGGKDDSANCLTPMKRVNKDTRIYDDPVDEIQNGPTTHKFVVTGRQRKSTFDVRETSTSVSGSQCVDISPNTEKLTLNGSTVLVRNVDYEVLYETGQITLLSPRAKDPNAAIDISYECNPPFQIQDKILLGTRLEYKLDGISDESILGATLLYKSQTTTAAVPDLGHEPFNQFLWGFNARLAGNPKWMTSAANLFPFVQTDAPSKANFEFEVAQSRYNPNTKETAYLDNFESSENILPMPTTIYSWFPASPPTYNDADKPDETLDYRHEGELIWHSSMKEVYSKIYGSTGNGYTDSREQTLLKFQFTPNDNFEGNSWGGVMRALSPGLLNESKKRTLEVVVNGREGNLAIDLGQISEDISIRALNNGAPDGKLESELQPGELTNSHDYGLDGLVSTATKGVVRWECKPNCYTRPISSADDDPGRDKWEEPKSDATEQSYVVNGTAGNNNATGGYGYDTEDLDRSGVLDTKNTFLRYNLPLDSACTADFHCEFLKNGWRKYQIPLYGTGIRIGAIAGENETQILSNVKMIRMWFGHLPARVGYSSLLLARVNLVGNAWEESAQNTQYDIDQDRFASGDLSDSLAVRTPPDVLDPNLLKVKVVNKQEEKNYIPSPDTKIERDTRTDEPLPERSLVLHYEKLHPGEAVSATRLLGSDPKDLTLYERILMDIHPDSNNAPNATHFRSGQNKVTLGLRLGKDQGNRDSKDYYEIKIHMDTAALLDSKQAALWNRNSFQVSTSDLTGLKNDSLYTTLPGRAVGHKVWHSGRGDSSITIAVVGNPTLSRIDWMRLVVYVDSTAVQTQDGDIWVDNLRLEGVNKSVGSAMRTQLQLDFADFVTVSGNLTYTNGNFTTMSQTKTTPANSNSNVDYNTNLSVFANKLFPDQWGVSIPLSMQYHGSISRPFTRPTSDLGLVGTDFMDIARDAADGHLTTQGAADSANDVQNRYARVYQTTVFEDRFSASYKKEHRSANFFNQVFFERPELQYSFASSDRSDFFTFNESRNYNTKLMYSLSPYDPKVYKPLSFAEKWKWAPANLSTIEFTPRPDKLNFTVADLSFVRTQTVNKPRNSTDIPVPVPPLYTVALTHGMDMEWRLLSFFNYGYRIAVDRDFDNEHGCFDETFWGQEDGGCNAGLFAAKDIAAWDGPDRHSDHLGDDYLVMYRERNRTESFHMDFNPNIFTWLTMGGNYNSGFHQTRVDSVLDRVSGKQITPEHFKTDADQDIKLNSSLSLPGLIGPSGDGKGFLGAVRKRLEDWRTRNLDVSYTVANKYIGEEYTYDRLRKTGMSPLLYYQYQLGFVYQDFGSFLHSLFDGEPNPQNMDYLMAPDPNLGQPIFSHNVSRTVDASTGFTVPWVDLAISTSVKYSKEYTLYRAIQPSDTSIVWPDLTLSGTFNDFAAKVPILHKNFKSMTATSTFNYRAEDKHSLFSQVPETQKTAYKLDPLLRLSATTTKDVRAEISFKTGLEKSIFYNKAEQEKELFRWYGKYLPGGDTLKMPVYRRIDTSKTPQDAFNLGADASLGYDIETQKGVQFWRYYVKLQNNLRLKVTSGVNYMYTERTLPGQGPHKDQNVLTATAKPEVSYNFTNNVDALAYFQYKYTKLYHTPREESTHEVDVHGEFTMRF